MSNLVKQSQLSEVSLELWRRIKNRYNGAFINARYEEATQKLILTPVEGAEVEVELTDLASKTLDNIFTGKNTFNDLTLGLPNKVVDSNIPTNLWGVLNNPIKTGNRKISSHAVPNSSGIVKNLVIRVEQVQPGDKANVNVWEVTKGADRSQDVPKLLHSNIEVDVIPKDGYFNGGNAIKCPINKKYDKDTYFIFQLLGNAKVFRAAHINPPSDDYVVIEENVDVTTENIERATRDEVGVQLLELGDVNILDLVSKPSGGTGIVTTVNSQPSDTNGNVTVNAEHISTQAGITVQEALDNKVDTTTLADYITETAADQKYVPKTQIGNNVGNIPEVEVGGKLNVAIIPDLQIANITDLQQALDERVKSVNNELPKPNGNVELKAEHIPYDNQTSQLTSDNVKEAIDELNGKFVSNVRYDTTDRSLHQTIDGSDTKIVDGIVTKWGDLEHVTQSRLKNIFDKNTQVEENKRYFFDHIEVNPDWKIAKIPCQAGDEFTVIKSVDNDSSQMGLFEAGDINIQNVNASHKSVKGRRVYHFTIPSSVTNVAYFVISMKNDVTNIDEVMVFKENVADGDIPTNYIPFSDGASVIINSNEVALTFDKTGTSLSSATIHSAIKELDRKIITTTGSVASINGQNGDITLSLENTADEIQFKVNGNKESFISYPTQGEIDAIKAKLIL